MRGGVAASEVVRWASERWQSCHRQQTRRARLARKCERAAKQSVKSGLRDYEDRGYAVCAGTSIGPCFKSSRMIRSRNISRTPFCPFCLNARFTSEGFSWMPVICFRYWQKTTARALNEMTRMASNTAAKMNGKAVAEVIVLKFMRRS